ncbi:hypothetical protein [Nonomuraea sp. NPDC049725]|uniref:hypothetical protein n=1 Tax=Nonomuraea sp. NPDC049725 TaxID=3154508 RepID=UPI00342F818F
MNVRTEHKAGPRQWLGLAVLLLPTMMLTADLGVLWLATPFLTADLRPSSAEFLWIIDIYGFMTAGFLVVMGTLGDGWMGPALNETLRTPALLAELGLSYVLDWTCDDQPFRLNVPGMLSVPYTVELNDLGLFTMHGMTGPDFLQLVKDQFDQLYADSATSGRVMALALHPFVIGQAFRTKYLDQALAYIAGHPGVWLTTSDDIADHYASTMP